MAVTASFRVLYIFVIIEHASRRHLHWNVTSNPTAAWTLQQLREAIASEHPYRFLVHDRDSIYTQALDTSIANLRPVFSLLRRTVLTFGRRKSA